MKNSSIFKKMMIATLLGFTAMTFVPPKSHALVGVATGMVPMMIVGGGVTLISVPLTEFLLNDGDVGGLYFFFTSLIGIIILDDKNQVSPHFTVLDATAALAMNIDPTTELNAYNNELSSINAINQTIVAETNQFNQPNTSVSDLSAFITQEWATYSQGLSPSAQSALKKLQASITATLNTAITQK